MPNKFTDRLEVVGTLAAIVCLLIFLGLALLHLGRLGQDDMSDAALRTNTLLGQVQYDVQQLSNLAERQEKFGVARQWEAVERRVAALVADNNRAALTRYATPIADWMTDMDLLRRRIDRGDLPISIAAPQIRVKVSQLVFMLRNAQSDISSVMAAAAQERGASTRLTLLGIAVCVAASLLCAGFLVMRLLQSLHRARRAEHALREERDNLEDTVRDRTRELVQAETQLRNAINSAPDGFAAFDAEGRLILANDMARALMPTAKELIAPGTPMSSILKATNAFLAPIDRGDGVFVHTAELEGADGSWVMITLRRSGDGSAVMRFADITPYKRATKTLEAALAREQNLRRLYKDFVAMVSHQFRTPLAIIDSSAQKILRHGKGAPWEEVADRAYQIRNASGGLVQLMDGTLDSAQLDSGEMAFNPVETQLRGLIEELCGRMADVYPDRQVVMNLDLLPDLVRCDPMLVEHVIGNLISNAAKYSPAGSRVSVSAGTTRHSVIVRVSDAGVGIPHEELERVFEPSYRGSNAGSAAGYGIGLHVARRIMRLHGGDIVAQSEAGQGTVVTLTLPFGKP